MHLTSDPYTIDCARIYTTSDLRFIEKSSVTKVHTMEWFRGFERRVIYFSIFNCAIV